MSTRSSLLVLLLASWLACAGSASDQSSGGTQPDETTSRVLRGSHSLTLGLGLLPQAQAEPGNVQANGFLGSLSYTYWPHSEWGLELSASLLDVDVSAGETTSVTSILLGTSYSPKAFNISSALYPYVTGAVGPYVGSTTTSYTASTRAETVVGARVGAGLDAYPWRRLRVGVRGAYHAVPTYENALGTQRSASGLQVSLEIGVMLGGR